ncbi:hypothetical protein [Flavobacterium granuli]|uniref:Uncharacterized protein n=1 Tax=Flavobacterium granuli TaxID=280093 RepID=A0ABU1S0H3_9FLAO|nr:hypothetical protein [Flavobacterium granuli]MDR6844537.1 hypothetical protein [Flavobacterium granuli]
MAYSSITIVFNEVPLTHSDLNILESSLGLHLNESFKNTRLSSGQVSIPDENVEEGGYDGYTSDNYVSAFNSDYNSEDLFSLSSYSGPESEGKGTVIITANYPGALFSVVLETADVTITITEGDDEPIDPEDPPPTFSFTPVSMAFVHQQNVPSPTQLITLTGDLWKVKSKPNFILGTSSPGVTIVSVTDGTGTYFVASGSGNAIVGVGLSEYYDSDAIFTGVDLAGTFEILKNNVHFGNINYTVSVSRLSDFFETPYTIGQKAFTLDPVFFKFQSENVGTYFQFNALINTYDFFTEELYENLIPQKVVLFKGKSEVNLGRLIHRLMRNFPDVNDNLEQYKFTKLQVTVSEKLFLDDSVVRSGTSADIHFVAGLSRYFENYGFLEFNPKPNRVTQKSFAYLNILIPAGSFELRTFKNGDLIATVVLPTDATTTLCKKVTFENFKQGDVIEYVIDLVGEVNEDAPKKAFYIFPNSYYSNMIVWENEFKVQSAIECTGTAVLDPDLEYQSQKVYKNLVEALEHLSTSKEVKMFIDTGWLLFTDIDTIESLMRSKRVWLVQGEKRISLRPIGKKLPKQDYEAETISFPLEFTINRAYDEETYTL